MDAIFICPSERTGQRQIGRRDVYCSTEDYILVVILLNQIVYDLQDFSTANVFTEHLFGDNHFQCEGPTRHPRN